MLTQEENDFLTRVGPGTPAGEMLRRYWHPVATHKDLTEERPTKFVRVLGEDLVLFKDKSGRVGLIADKCPHRSASMVYGRVEERGISCAYHGWLYDCDGNILETPPERNDAVMKNIKIKSYPVQTFVGLHWAYLGPAPAPVIPHYDIWMRKDGVHSVQVRPVLDANWLQPMENSADSPHLEILHQMSIGGGRIAVNTTRGFIDDVEAAFPIFDVRFQVCDIIVKTGHKIDLHRVTPLPLHCGSHFIREIPIHVQHTVTPLPLFHDKTDIPQIADIL